MRERTGKKKTRLETWLKSATTPVFLVSASRRVLFFNAGCEQLTGWTADEIVGEMVEFASDADPRSIRELATALCPLPTVWRKRTRCAGLRPQQIWSANWEAHPVHSRA